MKFLVILLVFAVPLFSQKAVEVQVDPVEKLGPGQSTTISIRVKVNEGWHVYAHNADHMHAFKVTPGATGGFTFGDPVYPQAVEGVVFEEKHWLYEKDFAVSLQVTPDAQLAPGTYELQLKVAYQGCSDALCDAKDLVLKVPVAVGAGAAPEPRETTAETVPAEGSASEETPAGGILDHGILGGLLAAFVAGIFTSLTPCVYPMIPITIAFFKAQSRTKSRTAILGLAFTFVLGIATLYTGVGVATAMFKKSFNILLQTPWVIGTLIAIFFLLGFSLFGMFTLQLPAFITNRAQVTRSGVLGAYGRGLFLGIVAAPCMVPVLALILALVPANPLMGGVLLFVYATGIGVLFIFLALFAGSLPKAGKWSYGIELLLGFVIICMALYFLEILVSLKILAIATGALAFFLGLYFVRQAWAGEHKKADRVASAAAFLLAAVFLAGFAVPVGENTLPEYALEQVFPHGDWLDDYDQGLAIAKKEGRPALVDVWAKWCIPCKEMDRTTFRDERVVAELGRFVKVKLDITDLSPREGEIMSQQDIGGAPSFLFFDSHGMLAKKIEGKVDTESMLAALKAVGR